jgi:hypothetical protein
MAEATGDLAALFEKLSDKLVPFQRLIEAVSEK